MTTFFKKHFRLLALLVIIVTVFFIGWKNFNKKSTTSQYQTTIVEKGNLIVSLSASGQVSTANSASVTTQASGVIKKIYVENGQEVKVGDKLAELELDMTGNQRSSSTWASYQGAKNSLDSANANLYVSQADLLTNWKTFMDTAQNSTYQNADGSPKVDQRQLPQYMITNDNWLAAEAKYKIQQNAILQAQTNLNNAWLSYQQTSPAIYAPISGTVTGLTLQIGSVINAQSNTSGTSTSQKIASILTKAAPTITVNLTEIDVPKVKIGHKATITLDALPGKTFTGKIVSIDTVGTVSSGVTTYPAVIKIDTDAPEMFTNMSAQANIITNTKDEVLLVPSSVVQTQNGETAVRVLKNGKISQITVVAGLSSDTQTEIISGLSEGDQIITNSSSVSTNGINQTQSPFGAFGGNRGNFGGAAIRVNGR